MTDELNKERAAALLASSAAQERQQGIVMAVRGGFASLIQQITTIAGNDSDEETRFLARKALERLTTEAGEHPDAQAFEQLSVEQLLQHADPHARSVGLKKVFASPDRTGRLMVLNALRTEAVPQLVASMIIGLGRFANPEDIAVIAPYLRHEDARIRANAVEALAMFESDEAYRFVVSSMSDEDHRVKTNVVRALQGIGGQSLFSLLKKMSQDDKLWTRASAAYAFYRIKSPQSLVALAQMALKDESPDVRRRALEYILSEKRDGNPVAAVILSKLEHSSPHEDFAAVIPEEQTESSSDEEFARLLASADPAHRYIALSRLSQEISTTYIDSFLEAFEREQDSFLLSMMLATVREKKLSGGFEHACRLLVHHDDRVRANAVEAVAAALPAGASLDCLLPLLKDRYSRVVANALLALCRYNRVDASVEIKNMLAKGREAFKRSALYVVSQLREPALVTILEQMLHDHNPRVRDSAFKILNDYADARVSGSILLLQETRKQIELEKSRDRFFENNLDKIFAGFLQLLRSVSGDSGTVPEKKVFDRNPQAERNALLQLGEKCLQNRIVDDKTLESLNSIEADLKHIEELISESAARAAECTVSEEAQRKSEQELLKIEQQSLRHRREAILTFLAFEVYSSRSHLDARTSSLLMADLGRVEANLCSFIPEHGFSMLPDETAAVSEFFDIAMRLYQKHVAAFSIYTLWQFGRWALLFTFFSVVLFGFSYLDKFVGGVFAFIFIPYLAYKTLGIMVEWKINIALMVDDGIHGREYERERIAEKAGDLYDEVFASSLKKHLLLALWFIVAMVMSGTVLAAGMVTETSTVATDLANMVAMLILIAVFASAYFKYLLVEPAAILTPARDSFATSETLFLRDRARLITLFVFSTFIIQLVTGTSVEIVTHISSTLPAMAGTVLVVALSFISDMCLAPIVFATLCVYSLVHLKKMS
ncbi:MAG: hypothetical protein GQF41_2950 [Candidatus Rifleibacterium amylolyticum]|nr:MAG: hypothetical protein GQF41_2950 [Candidatus Rifleibacterium amylolyticum]